LGGNQSTKNSGGVRLESQIVRLDDRKKREEDILAEVSGSLNVLNGDIWKRVAFWGVNTGT